MKARSDHLQSITLSMSTIGTRIESTPTTGVTPIIITNITSIALRILFVVSVTIVVTTFYTDTAIVIVVVIVIVTLIEGFNL